MSHFGESHAERYRQRLTEELAELLAASQESKESRAPVTLDQQSVGRLARMDAMQVQAMAAATEQRRQMRIARIKSALNRMAEDEYGYCLSCGEAIAEGRLEIDPTSTLCLTCAGQKER